MALFPPSPHTCPGVSGGTQGYGTGKDVVFTDMGGSRGYRVCYAPTSVTPEEGGLYVSNVGMGISSQITWIGSRIIMV